MPDPVCCFLVGLSVTVNQPVAGEFLKKGPVIIGIAGKGLPVL